MNKERIIDLHIHSDNSPDGNHSPMFICEQAVDKGLRAVAITDHCEIDSYFERRFDSSIFHSYFETSKARTAFEGQLLVLSGIELGQPLNNISLTEKIITNYSVDVILGSIHKPKGMGCDIKEIDYTKIDVYEFMTDYFNELTELAKSPLIDVVAHITCPMRGIKGIYGIDFDYSRVSDATDKLLKTIIENNRSLEINTSGLSHPMKATMPDVNLIRRFKELGGKHITLGSDSHSAYTVGNGIKEGLSIAKECGFDCITFYVNRQMFQLEI